MTHAAQFMAAFRGHSAAHGQTIIKNERKQGKQQAQSYIVRQPLTLELVEGHLNGQKGVGAIPINEDNQCYFGALDIDTYPLDLQALDKKLRDAEVPAIVCRSKSGGAHVFFFFTKPIAAGDFRDKASEISAFLGYGGCEIFPKQEELLHERNDVGNFINLPYFDQELTTRYAILPSGDEADLGQFLELVNTRGIEEPATFLNLQLGGSSEQFKEWPPCLKYLLTMGIPEGGRNTTMFNVGVACKMVDPDNWKALHEEINTTYCIPPLPASEIVTIQSQLEKKDTYYYTCEQQPMASKCDKLTCKRMKYGIGSQQQTLDVGGLSVLLSEPRLWFMDVNGRRLELSTEELQVPLKFQRACMEQLNFMPTAMKPTDWQVVVNDMMENLNTIEVPEELTFKGQFAALLEDYCTGRIQAQSPEEMTLGKPWTDEGKVFFKLEGLMQYLKLKNFNEYTRAQIQERLKIVAGDDECHGLKRYKTTKGDWKSIRVWWVPEFAGEVEVDAPHVPTTEVPF